MFISVLHISAKRAIFLEIACLLLLLHCRIFLKEHEPFLKLWKKSGIEAFRIIIAKVISGFGRFDCSVDME